MKKFFLILFILFAAFPGWSRQLAWESPQKEPAVLKAKTQSVDLYPALWLERLAKRLESLALSPSVGIPVFWEFVFQNPARRYASQITQFFASNIELMSPEIWSRPKVPP